MDQRLPRSSTELLRDKTLLVTGGTGSFGHRVATALAHDGLRSIRILSRDEEKQDRMRHIWPEFDYVLCDVRDETALTRAMRGADVVFHAAALKQVPSSERQPEEYIKTNVLGTMNVVSAARANDVSMVIGLSTDKAVKPLNTMGLTKALMEKVLLSPELSGGSTRFCCVRYGNVIGSRGSVVPLFCQQIENKTPLTITDPNMTRFLMSLEDAVRLVRYAIETTNGSEVFVHRAPAASMDVVAKACAYLYSGNVDWPVRVTGPRPGEKLHEVLVHEYEMTRAIETESYFVIPGDHPSDPAADRSERWFGQEYASDVAPRIEDPVALAELIDTAFDGRSQWTV